MGNEFQKSALPTLFHFVRVRAALQPYVKGFSSCFIPKLMHLYANRSKLPYDEGKERASNIDSNPVALLRV